MNALMLGLLWVVTLFQGPAGPPSHAQNGVIIDNERVLVHDQTLPANGGAPGPLYLTAGRAVAGGAADGPGGQARQPGDVIFIPKGAAGERPAAGAPPLRVIQVDLKDHAVPPLANTSGYPNAFPRPGIKKVFENDRIIVWDYTWTPGVPTPMHFHDKDVVVTYLEEGALTSTTPDGQHVINPHHFGYTKFNARNRVHTELLARGQARAIIIELK
jgi:hypothetical protein